MLSKEEIKQLIPYSDDSLLIDEVLELEQDKITAKKTVTEADCKGHFRDFPIFPGVKTIEGMAQAASLLIRKNIENHEQKHILAYKADDTIFKSPVYPGDELLFHIQLSNLTEKRATAKCEAYKDDTQVAQTILTLAIVNKSEYK